MAVSVDNVYQKVLAFANKEQRGYITPQEFNLFADHAQMEIFEQYFYDLEQIKRRVEVDNAQQHASAQTNLEDKIDLFIRSHQSVTFNVYGQVTLSSISDFYKLSGVRVTYMGVPNTIGANKYSHTTAPAERISYEDSDMRNISPLFKQKHSRPTYKQQSNVIQVQPYPNVSTDDIQIHYIRKPLKPSWGYVVVSDKPLYNSAASINFELHPSEESELVYRILAYAGIAIEKPQLTQVAMGLEGAKVQQEKQ